MCTKVAASNRNPAHIVPNTFLAEEGSKIQNKSTFYRGFMMFATSPRFPY